MPVWGLSGGLSEASSRSFWGALGFLGCAIRARGLPTWARSGTQTGQLGPQVELPLDHAPCEGLTCAETLKPVPAAAVGGALDGARSM